jgi:hypothetical protein
MIRVVNKAVWIALIIAIFPNLLARAEERRNPSNTGHATESSVPSLEWGDFAFNGQKYPILYQNQTVLVKKQIASVGFFKPLQSPDRPEVNPGQPQLRNIGNASAITFERPGEYYLILNKDFRLKVLILDKDRSIDLNVLALFDFVAANMSNISGNDSEWYAGPDIFVRSYFSSDQPKMVLCGPTKDFFNILVRGRFGLPTRSVTFTGVYFEQGRVQYTTHNVLEVYLPEHKKWVLFDPNNGMVAKWKDAFELTEAVREASATKTSFTKDDFGRLKLDFHTNVDVKKPFNNFSDQNLFFSGMLSSESVRDFWPVLFQLFLGGPGYWGGVTGPGRTAALPAEYHVYSSVYHLDPFLVEAQNRWIANWNLKVLRLSPDDLKRRLDESYAAEIAERKWEEVTWR